MLTGAVRTQAVQCPNISNSNTRSVLVEKNLVSIVCVSLCLVLATQSCIFHEKQTACTFSSVLLTLDVNTGFGLHCEFVDKPVRMDKYL